jgi:hypothetical protein
LKVQAVAKFPRKCETSAPHEDEAVRPIASTSEALWKLIPPILLLLVRRRRIQGEVWDGAPENLITFLLYEAGENPSMDFVRIDVCMKLGNRTPTV